MKTFDYSQIRNSLNNLNYSQLKKVKKQINQIENQKIVAKKIDKAKKIKYCSHCKSNKIVKWGRQSDLQRYKCNSCNKTFNSLTGTPLANLRKKSHWLEYAQCLINGKSIRKSAFHCAIDKTTSFRWRHRFLKNSNNIMINKLKGIIELDELIQNKSYKGAKNISSEILNKKEKIFIVFARDRYGNTINSIFEKLTPLNLAKIIGNKFEKDNLICTKQHELYFKFTNLENLRHGYIDIENGETVKKDIVHIKNVVNFYEELLNWMKRFRGVATKYLENYLSWYRGLEEKNMNPTKTRVLKRAFLKFEKTTNNANN